MNPALSSIKKIESRLTEVTISENGIDVFTSSFKPNSINHWLSISPFNIHTLNIEDRIHFLLILNAMSFCYWGDPKWSVEYRQQSYDGAQGMMAALGRAIEAGTPILETSYLSQLTETELAYILRGNVAIPLLKERLMHLNEVGRVLEKNFHGHAKHIIEFGHYNALEIVNILIEYFPSFKDIRDFHGETIFFNKRAQLCVADIAYALQTDSTKQIQNIHLLTACADYKLPQVLQRYGIFEYKNMLAEKIQHHIEIPEGSEAEITIRAQTILAIEKIKGVLKEKYPDITTIQINDYLWLEGQAKLPNDKPYHRTRTTSY